MDTESQILFFGGRTSIHLDEHLFASVSVFQWGTSVFFKLETLFCGSNTANRLYRPGKSNPLRDS